jgi:hypothetical protein
MRLNNKCLEPKEACTKDNLVSLILFYTTKNNTTILAFTKVGIRLPMRTGRYLLNKPECYWKYEGGTVVAVLNSE